MSEHMRKSDTEVLHLLPFTADSMEWQARKGCVYYHLASPEPNSISVHVNSSNNRSQNLGHHAASVPAAVDKLLSTQISLVMKSTMRSWQQDRHATLNRCVPQLGLHLKHEIGSGEVNGTSCATGRLQSNDFEVSQVYS